MKRAAILALVFATAFSLLGTWLGPKWIGWYVTPADQPAALSCSAAVIGALNRLVRLQFISTGIGAVIGIILAFVFRTKAPPPAPAAKA